MAHRNIIGLTIVIIFLVNGCSALREIPPGSAGVVTNHEGTPCLLRATQYLELGPRSPVELQDVLLTDTDDRLLVHLEGHVSVSMGYKSQVGIHQVAEDHVHLSLGYGIVNLKRNRSSPVVEISTRWGTVLLQKGSVIIEMQDQDRIRVAVAEKSVALVTNFTGKSQLVETGGALLLPGQDALEVNVSPEVFKELSQRVSIPRDQHR